MKTKIKFKYGLQNASSYLHKFRLEKESEHNNSREAGNEKEKTFDEGQIVISKESPNQAMEKQRERKCKIRHQLDMNPDLNKKVKNEQFIKKNRSEKLKIDSEFFEKATMIQQEDEERQKSGKVGLSDLIIINYLTNTLKIYRQDLTQLQQNRDNLIEAIDEIALKIQGLTDLQNKNKILELQNFKNKKELSALLKQYHEIKLNTEIKKIKINENFNRKKDKIKMLLELFQQENQYVVEIQSWKEFFYQLNQNTRCLEENPPSQQVFEEIFPKIDKCNQNSKKKEKGKLVDKSGLLGDLKNFAKNFKMPNNNNVSDF